MSDLTSTDIKRALKAMWDGNHSSWTEVNGGSAWGGCRRMDVVALEHTWKPPCVKVAEVKVSRRDFLQDRKWPEYLRFANEFYWACPTGLISRDEIDERAGLIVVNPSSRKATVLKRPPYNDTNAEAAFGALYYLLTWRHSGVDDREQRMERIRKEMRERDELGTTYRRFVAEQLTEANKQAQEAKREAELARDKLKRETENYQRKLEKMGVMKEYVQAALSCNPEMSPHQFSQLLRGAGPSCARAISRLRDNLTWVENLLNSKEAEGE